MARLEVSLIKREERGQMSARRMSANIDAVGVAAVFADMPRHPGEGIRHVLNLRRVRVLRRKTVTHHGDHDALAGKPIAQRRIEGTVPGLPRAAVNEDKNRRIRFVFGQVEVELVFGFVFRFAFDIDDVLLHGHVRRHLARREPCREQHRG